MKTVGNILREERIKKGQTLTEIEQATKIRLKFLDAIERDDYTTLPSLSYAKGFVKNYSEFLGLDSRRIMAFFRRQTTDIAKSSLLPKGMAEPLNRSLFQLTPGKFLAFLLIGLLALFLLYFGMQYGKLYQSPALVIESPADQTVIQEKRIEVLGKTDPDATVTINGVSVLVRGDGRFFDQVALEPGVNKITITATSRFGKTTTIMREVGNQQP